MFRSVDLDPLRIRPNLLYSISIFVVIVAVDLPEIVVNEGTLSQATVVGVHIAIV